MAAKCGVGCIACTSLTACSSCIASFTLTGGLCYGTCPVRSYATSPNSPSSTCNRCPYDCYTCYSNGDCLSCNQTVDFRTLTGTRCVPMVGYYQSGMQIAAKCPQECSACTSAQNCSGCSSGYFLQGVACLSNCPTSNSFSTSASQPDTCQDLMPELYLDKFVIMNPNNVSYT